MSETREKITRSSKISQPKFIEGEKILCYHGTMIYEAKCLKFEKSRSNEYLYYVHYNGWNKNWDEWVPSKRILKYNDENLKKQQDLISNNNKAINATKKTKSKEDCSSSSSTCSTSDTGSSAQLGEKQNKTTKNINKRQIKNEIIKPKSNTNVSNTKSQINLVETQTQSPNKKICVVDISLSHNKFSKLPTEDNFLNSNDQLANNLQINIPDNLKIWLVDDFDFIIQQNKLIQLPSTKPISTILNEYSDYKLNKSHHDQIEQEINPDEEEKKYLSSLDITLNGLIKYFNKMIGSQLLYKFERLQYSEMLKMKKPMTDIYGSIHFLRLIERLNQILANSNIHQEESFDCLIFYANDILMYIDKNIESFMNQDDYITAPPFYVRASI